MGNQHLKGGSDLKKLREKLQTHEGENVDVTVVSVSLDDRIAAAEVALSLDVCANDYPHVTLAHGTGVPPNVSNELLARRAANRDLAGGLEAWLAQLRLAELAAPIMQWCDSSGARSADDIVRN